MLKIHLLKRITEEDREIQVLSRCQYALSLAIHLVAVCVVTIRA